MPDKANHINDLNILTAGGDILLRKSYCGSRFPPLSGFLTRLLPRLRFPICLWATGRTSTLEVDGR